MAKRLTPREKNIKEIVKNHLPEKSVGEKARTGSPVCGLLDILNFLGVPLPYNLKS